MIQHINTLYKDFPAILEEIARSHTHAVDGDGFTFEDWASVWLNSRDEIRAKIAEHKALAAKVLELRNRVTSMFSETLDITKIPRDRYVVFLDRAWFDFQRYELNWHYPYYVPERRWVLIRLHTLVSEYPDAYPAGGSEKLQVLLDDLLGTTKTEVIPLERVLAEIKEDFGLGPMFAFPEENPLQGGKIYA